MKYILYAIAWFIGCSIYLAWVLLCLTIRFLWDFKLASFEMIVLGPMRIWDWLAKWERVQWYPWIVTIVVVVWVLLKALISDAKHYM